MDRATGTVLVLFFFCCEARSGSEAEIEQQLLQVMKSRKKSSSWRHSGETGGKQELKERQDAAEETPMMGDVFQPRVLLHPSVLAADVKEEAPEEQSPEGEQQESELLHIKEEQEEPGVHQEGEQLLVKEETDSRFPLTAAPINMLAADVKEEAPEEQSPEEEQQESELLHIKEEQEEPGVHQEGEQLLVKEETDAKFPLTAAPINMLAADVKEEAPEEQSPEGEQQESELLHIKEEQEEPGVHQEGEQLLVKEETDSRFPLSAAPITNVQQKLLVKEEPHADLHDPQPPHIKEEQKELCISLSGEQLNGKEVINAIRFPVTAPLIKTLDDEQSLLLSQLYPDQIKDRELLEENDDEESIRIQDYGDNSLSLETEYTEKDEEDNVVEHPLFELKHLSDSAFKKCSTEKKIVESQRKVKTGIKLSCEDCGKIFIKKSALNTHMRVHMGEKPFCCDLCGQTFNQKAHLNRHMGIHTDE
ncbi:uncharacterized protein V3H82_002086, partial [Fundulus diaphanus]